MDTQSNRKARGAFFTPAEISRYLAQWAIQSANDVVLEPSCGEASFLLAAGERLRQAVAQAPFTAGDLVLPLTVSIGLAVLRADDAHFDSLLRRADEALYAAKAAGRNRVEVAL